MTIRFDEDHHVHSTFSQDAVSTPAENVAAARARGLREICLTEHVRQGSTQVPAFVAAVLALPPVPGLAVRTGVEAKILDHGGHLDLPNDVDGVDRVLIADHAFPGPAGPLAPGEVRAALAAGETTPAEAVEVLVRATVAALDRVSRPQLAHLFSILPKVGLAESDVSDSLLALLTAQARASGAVVEANEKWACPSARVLAAFAAAGVRLVASTDSHCAAEVGVYRRAPAIAGEILAGSA